MYVDVRSAYVCVCARVCWCIYVHIHTTIDLFGLTQTFSLFCVLDLGCPSGGFSQNPMSSSWGGAGVGAKLEDYYVGLNLSTAVLLD